MRSKIIEIFPSPSILSNVPLIMDNTRVKKLIYFQVHWNISLFLNKQETSQCFSFLCDKKAPQKKVQTTKQMLRGVGNRFFQTIVRKL